MIRIEKSINNIPLIELNNFCIENNADLDLERESIILLEVKEVNK